MQLVPFHGHRVGFWLAQSSPTARQELNAQATPVVHGTPEADGVTLVVAAADAEDRIVWSHLLHSPRGAALCADWGDRLVVAIGATLLVLGPAGEVEARYDAGDDELVNAHVGEGALVLVGRRALHVLEPGGRLRWTRPVVSGGLAWLGLSEGTLRFAAFPEQGDDWVELHFDGRDGTPL